MNYRNWQWKVKDRQRFIATLTETGNPAAAAAAIGQTLAAAYAMRERWPQLAEEWRAALGIAWEQVEMRLLATLLDGDAGEIDAKVALEMLKRRPTSPPRAIVTVDAARIARVRQEIRALAAPAE
ncbi:hypothetical protein IP88_16700 [alpha proteobacterium AAP81b]|nr:hypothetical protein IP88_16700 [alpha proteobacterium AAP81b]